MAQQTSPIRTIRVRKPKTLLFDISGTIIKSSFNDKVLRPYINRENIKRYLVENWDTAEVKLDIKQLRVLSEQQNVNVPKIKAADEEREQLLTEMADYVQYCMDTKTDSEEFAQMRLNVWIDAYNRDRLVTPVYSDAAKQLQHWHNDLSLEMVAVSNGWSKANKIFLTKTNHGNLDVFIRNYFDPYIGSLTESTTYRKILAALHRTPQEILFLTKDPLAGRAANQIDISVMLVLTHTDEIKQLDYQAKKVTRIRTFKELSFNRLN